MTKNCSVWRSNQSIKSQPEKDDEQNQSQNMEEISIRSPSSRDVDTLTSVSEPTKDPILTSKRVHKHRNHRCHHHHHHHHHHHRRHPLKKKTQPVIIVPRVNRTVESKTSANPPKNIASETTLKDGQKASTSVSNHDQTTKSNKGNIPLQPVENKLVSHRVAPTNETQVGNFPSMVCTQSVPSIVNSGCVQAIEQIVYQDDCCLPGLTSCCVQQPESFICLPQQHQQQQQQQIFFCTDPTSTQDYICSSSNQIQSTICNQVPVCASSVGNFSNSPLLCVSQPSTIQPSANIIIQQQPQIFQMPQAQPQIIQVSQAQPQIIQVPQAQPAQYLQITSASPQIIQTIQAPGVQNFQPQMVQTVPVASQFVAANPQLLYQRPYDPIVIPVQNQQFAIAQNPMVALSQPSYAPVRRQGPAPRLFQQALVQTVANRVGVPLPLSNFASGSPFMGAPAFNPTRGAALASAGRALLTNGLQPSRSSPIIPLTPGGLLIPYEPSEPPKGMVSGALPRRTGFPPNRTNYDLVRQQIQQRARLLADLQRISSAPAVSPRRNLVDADLPLSRPPFFSQTTPAQPPAFSSNAFPSFARPAPMAPQPAPMIRSQTPYTNRNPMDVSSSSSSSRSSRSSTSAAQPMSNSRSAPSNLIYAFPSVADTGVGSNLSGPSAPYQSLRP